MEIIWLLWGMEQSTTAKTRTFLLNLIPLSTSILARSGKFKDLRKRTGMSVSEQLGTVHE